jgi:antitoxin component of MazEF toxin-antitoxin module
MNCEIRKIIKLSKASLGAILPKSYLEELAIDKGDFIEINKENDKIIIKKLKV